MASCDAVMVMVDSPARRSTPLQRPPSQVSPRVAATPETRDARLTARVRNQPFRLDRSVAAEFEAARRRADRLSEHVLRIRKAPEQRDRLFDGNFDGRRLGHAGTT